jgi:hypothetical protein
LQGAAELLDYGSISDSAPARDTQRLWRALTLRVRAALLAP